MPKKPMFSSNLPVAAAEIAWTGGALGG